MRRTIRLTYDVRMLGHSGIGTQVDNVLRGLAARSEVELNLVGDPVAIRQVLPDFDGRITKFTAPIYSVREQLRFPRPDETSILLLPHYNAPVRFLSGAVVVLHDLIHLHSGQFRAPHYRAYATGMLSCVARRASRILTVSQYTHDDFVARFPGAAGRTITNHNGVEHSLFAPPKRASVEGFRRRYQLPARFLLCVGIGKRHKNVDFVVRALAPFWHEGTFALPLVLAGAGGAVPDYIYRGLPGGLPPEVIPLPHLDRAELPLLYAAAEVLVMPSLFEGFGFPVVEAMATGTPVLAASATSLPEVGGRAAAYFEPGNAISFTDGLFRITGSVSARNRMKKAGIRQAARFNWERHVDCLLGVLRELDHGPQG